MRILKAIWSELVWYGLALVICAAALALMILLGYGLYLLTQAPWLLDGSNPRYGG